MATAMPVYIWFLLPILGPMLLILLRGGIGWLYSDANTATTVTGTPSKVIVSILDPFPDITDELCTICQEDYSRPVSVPCKHTFCESCIRSTLAQRDSCPICNHIFFTDKFIREPEWHYTWTAISILCQALVCTILLASPYSTRGGHAFIEHALQFALTLSIHGFLYAFAAFTMEAGTYKIRHTKQYLPYFTMVISFGVMLCSPKVLDTLGWAALLMTWVPCLSILGPLSTYLWYTGELDEGAEMVIARERFLVARVAK